MAINLYALKMYMFSEEMEYDKETQGRLQRVSQFLAVYYSAYWKTAMSAADASMNDLLFFQNMITYSFVDPEVSQVVLGKLKNHCWYFTQETVIYLHSSVIILLLMLV